MIDSEAGSSVAVTLDWFEVERAASVGVSRNVEAMKKGRRQRLSKKAGDDFSVHILGALGECAFCKAAGKYWPGTVNTFKDPDVPPNIQVRTRSNHDYDLIVRDTDSDDDVFVLVTGGPEYFLVHGWISGLEAKSQEWRCDYGSYGEAYFVPKAALHSIESMG